MKQKKALTTEEYDEELKVELQKYSLEELREMLTETMSKIYAYFFVHHEIISNYQYKTVKGDQYIAEEDKEHLDRLISIAVSYIDNFLSETFDDLHVYFSITYRPYISIDMTDPTDFSNKNCLTIGVTDWNYPNFTEDNTRNVLRYFLLWERTLIINAH